MKQKKILILLCMSISILLAYIIVTVRTNTATFKPAEYSDKIMGVFVVEETVLPAEMKKLSFTENPGIYFENTLLPYSARENQLYLSQSHTNKDWIGELTAKQDAYLCMPPDSYWHDKEKAILEGHPFTLWLVTEQGYYELELVMCGMPVMSIQTQSFQEPEEISYEEDPDKFVYDSETLYYGDITLFNPDINCTDYEIVECNLEYHQKGATSAGFSKKSYSVSLQTWDGQNLNISLLGMRSDNNWKLNALVSDPNRIREKTAAEIWQAFDSADSSVSEPGPRMEYVELILDNDYQGIYCLVEPIDEQKLELDNNDILYKVIEWEPPTDAEIQDTINHGWKVTYPVRIRYPEVINDYTTTWYPMRNYLNSFYHDQVTEKHSTQLYPQNAADMYLFCMVISGSDNAFKNMYYAADVSTNGSYKIRQLPWDLDLTFGNIYEYTSPTASIFNPDTEIIYEEAAVPTLLYYEPESIKPILSTKWTNYRCSFLSTEAILQKLINNRDYLIQTGAYIRENARWEEYPMSKDIDYLLQYQTERMNWLDRYITDITE